MKASDIISKARYSLSDTKITSARWSNDRLLSLLNDCLLDISLTTYLYYDEGYITLESGQSVYDISDFAAKILRIEFCEKPLDLISHTDLDKRNRLWRESKSDVPTHVIYDLKLPGKFMLYPKYEKVEEVISDDCYGIITGFSQPIYRAEIISDLGIADVEIKDLVKVNYLKLPTDITSVDDDLDDIIHRHMISGIAHYVSGMAIRDNLDAQNRNLGVEELSLYQQFKQNLVMRNSGGNVSDTYNINYSPTS